MMLISNARKCYRKEPILYEKQASLTLEAAIVLPLFLYFMIILMYFIQICTIQEQIQAGITQMGMSLSKTAYIYEEFIDFEELIEFDDSILADELEIGLQKLTDKASSGIILKLYSEKYLDKERINRSCIKDGMKGLSFMGSSILGETAELDIIVRYQLEIPIKLFGLEDFNMIQRVKLRGWTGYAVTPVYTNKEENSEESVYITETGSVYHTNPNCSHIKLSVREISGLPSGLRNDNGGIYYPCEACGTGEESNIGIYYITSDGTRYHTIRNCSKITRKVREISITDIGSRRLCKRCSGK